MRVLRRPPGEKCGREKPERPEPGRGARREGGDGTEHPNGAGRRTQTRASAQGPSRLPHSAAAAGQAGGRPSYGQLRLPVLDAVEHRQLLPRREDVVRADVPAHHHRGDSDAREGAVPAHVEALQWRLVARQHVGRRHPGPVGARRLAQEAPMRQRRAHHLQHDPLADVGDLLLDGPQEELLRVLLLAEVLLRALLEVLPVLPRLSGRRVGVKAVVAWRGQLGVQHGRAAHKHRVAGRLQVVPVLEDAPLRGELLAVPGGQALRLEAEVQVDERLKLWVLRPGCAEVLLQLGGRAGGHEASGDPVVRVADDRLARPEHAPVPQPHPGSAAALHQQLLHVRLQQHLTARMLLHSTHQGVDHARVAAFRVVQRGSLLVHVGHHVRHHAGRRPV
mmetsp:Transcript_62738/g.178277  ORF Transcript_62738/g.178277 Transcript_62738/m.178277 type:complete len:391 (-) Transcript_62738:637-1809(-)